MPPDFIKGDPLPLGGYIPLFKVFVVVGNLRTPDMSAVIDSGSDTTIVPFQIPAAFGVAWEALGDAPAVRGFGGDDPAKYWEVEVRSSRWPSLLITRRVVTVRRNVPIVLGRDDFFAQVRLEFHWYRNPAFYEVEPA